MSLVAALGCGRVSFTPRDAGTDAFSELDIDAAVPPDASSDAPVTADDAGRDAPSTPDAGRDAPPLDAFSPPDATFDSATDAALDGGPCVPTTVHPDRDGDGFGDPRQANFLCVGPGYVRDATDCDDTSDVSHPGGVEVCNCHDDDCNGVVDQLASCRAASHVVWARAYGGPSSDLPWQMATDGTTLHLCGQSGGDGFEILPGERTRSTDLFQAAFDARTGLGLRGNNTACGSVALRLGRLWTFLADSGHLEFSDERRSIVSWRHAPTGVAAYGDAVARLALASDTGTVFVVAGYQAPATLGMGPLPELGATDVALYALDLTGRFLWQRPVGTTADDFERGVATTPAGDRVAIRVNAPGPIDMGGGELAGTDPHVFAVYTGDGGFVHAERSAELDVGMGMAGDGTLYLARLSGLEVREPAGTLRETRLAPAGALVVGLAVSPGGDVYVSYQFPTPITVDGTVYTPTDAADGLLVVHGPTGSIRWAQQLDVPPTTLVAGPSGEVYAIATIMMDEPVDECGGVAATGGGGAGDADMLLMMLR